MKENINYKKVTTPTDSVAIAMVNSIYDPIKNLESNMVYVEGGSFEMGSNAGDSDEKPIHTVTLSSFSINKYEVTQSQWEAVIGSNPSKHKGCSTCPVENVSWNGIQEFLTKLNIKTRKNYRLPTEAQWEYAARGGNKSKGYSYSGSNNPKSVAWYDETSVGNTHEVGQKQANELGIYDMSGNASEWCRDWYDYYNTGLNSNPLGPNIGKGRVLRGGGWSALAQYCRVADRRSGAPGYGSSGRSFRLALIP